MRLLAFQTPIPETHGLEVHVLVEPYSDLSAAHQVDLNPSVYHLTWNECSKLYVNVKNYVMSYDERLGIEEFWEIAGCHHPVPEIHAPD